MASPNLIRAMELKKIQDRIATRIQDNNPGVAARGVDIDTWKALEIPIDIRRAHGLQWNLYTDVSANGFMDVVVTPSGSYDMKASYPLGDSVDGKDSDGWSYGSICKYSH